MQRHFDDQIQELLQRVVLMGSIAEAMIRTSLRALVERNEALLAEVFRKEEEVNDLQIEIDEQAVTLTGLHQPVGTDLRFLFMVPRITSELERIADQAVNIAQNTQHLMKTPLLKPLVDLPVMGEIVQGMVRDGIDALVKRDVALTERILENEKKVDAFKNMLEGYGIKELVRTGKVVVSRGARSAQELRGV